MQPVQQLPIQQAPSLHGAPSLFAESTQLQAPFENWVLPVMHGDEGLFVQTPSAQGTHAWFQQYPPGQGIVLAAQTMQVPASSHVPFVRQGVPLERTTAVSTQVIDTH